MDTITKKSQYNESVMTGETEETKARKRKIQKCSLKTTLNFFL